jgi:hypothetical protein
MESFMESFGAVIDSAENKSPFKDPEFIKNLCINPNSSDFIDYGAV